MAARPGTVDTSNVTWDFGKSYAGLIYSATLILDHIRDAKVFYDEDGNKQWVSGRSDEYNI